MQILRHLNRLRFLVCFMTMWDSLSNNCNHICLEGIGPFWSLRNTPYSFMYILNGHFVLINELRFSAIFDVCTCPVYSYLSSCTNPSQNVWFSPIKCHKLYTIDIYIVSSLHVLWLYSIVVSCFTAKNLYITANNLETNFGSVPVKRNLKIP